MVEECEFFLSLLPLSSLDVGGREGRGVEGRVNDFVQRNLTSTGKETRAELLARVEANVRAPAGGKGES